MTNLRPRYIGRIFTGLAWVCAVIVAISMIGGLVWCNQTGCEGDPERAKRVLESAGYKQIEVGGAHGRRCSDDDRESNTFTAFGPTGKYTEGVVCCSYEGCGKGCTIRLEP